MKAESPDRKKASIAASQHTAHVMSASDWCAMSQKIGTTHVTNTADATSSVGLRP
jgi:hypothetical protein